MSYINQECILKVSVKQDVNWNSQIGAMESITDTKSVNVYRIFKEVV